jgi:hypothetical protein
LGERLFRALCTAPLVALATILFEAAYLRVLLGRFPVYPEDPGSLVARVLMFVVAGLFWVCLLGFPFVVVVPLAHIGSGRWRGLLPWSGLFIGGITAMVFVMRHDPTTFTDWFLD